MGIHLYCMLERGAHSAPPTGLSGLAGECVRTLELDGVEAWVSDVPRDLPVTLDAVTVHDEVVEAALATGITPVPARYGQRFDSDESCGHALTRRIEPLRALLSRVAGCVEMTVIVTPSTKRMLRELDAESVPGRQPSLVSQRSPARRLLDQIQHAAAPWIRGHTTHEPVVRRLLLTASHLVERGASEAYRAAVAAVPAGPALRVLVVGPRAPYSFCATPGQGLGTHGMNLAD